MKKQAISISFAILVVLASVSLQKLLANVANAANPWQNTSISALTSAGQSAHMGSSPAPIPPYRHVAMGSSPAPIPPYRQVAMGSSPAPIPPYRHVAMGSSPAPIPPYRQIAMGSS
ncbi:MAG: hypothetical protein ACRD10_11955, partial [Terriglobia bacterium]